MTERTNNIPYQKTDKGRTLQWHPNNYMLLKLCVQWIANYYSKTYKNAFNLLIARKPLTCWHWNLTILIWNFWNLSENILKMWIEHGRRLRRHCGPILQISPNWLRIGILYCLKNHLSSFPITLPALR